MMDWLYNELEQAQSAQFAKHVEGCNRCTVELDSLTRTRAVFREMPIEEPPQALTAILLHEAAKRAPAVEPKTEESRGGFGAWLVNFFQPMMMHPAATAVATLIVVGGVAGALYISGNKDMVARPSASSEATAPSLAYGEDEGESEEPSFDPAAVATPPAKPSVANGDFAPDNQPAPEPADKAVRGLGRNEAPGQSAFGGSPVGSRDKNYAADLVDTEQKQKLADAFKEKPKANRKKPEEARQGEGFRVSGVRPDADRKAKKRSKQRPKRDFAADTNAVSGADPLLSREELDEDDGDDLSEDEGGGSDGEAVLAAEPAPPPRAPTTTAKSASSYRAYKDTTTQKREIEWAKRQERNMSKALKKKRGCQEAARIANDILDRNPDYYSKKIKRSKAVKDCKWYVSNERRRRSVRAQKRARGGKATKSSKPKAGKKRSREKAAPAHDAME